MMQNGARPAELEELAALSALDLCTPDESGRLAALVKSDTRGAAIVGEHRETAAALGLSLTPVAPPKDLRARLFARISEPRKSLSGFAEEIPGFHVLRSGAGAWRETGLPGVTAMALFIDRAASMMTSLLRLEPGASFPPHRHTSGEQCWVIEGDVRHSDQDLALKAGDFFVANPDTHHTSITSDGGCLLLIIASTRDEIQA